MDKKILPAGIRNSYPKANMYDEYIVKSSADALWMGIWRALLLEKSLSKIIIGYNEFIRK
jgi:hypothetical protein